MPSNSSINETVRQMPMLECCNYVSGVLCWVLLCMCPDSVAIVAENCLSEGHAG